MPRSATDTDVWRESFGRSYSPEDMEHTESHSVSGEGHGARAGRTFTARRGPKLWSVVVMSVLSSAVAVAAVGCLCALIYPILKELRAERVRGQDGTEERMLGFWSILVLSVLAGCICCVFSWTLTYLDSQQTGIPTLTLTHFRDGFHMGYGVAVLNGIMAVLTVIWSLT
ncbi:ADP-ribosylation factor-like protein 6-interacting protein 6 [Dicentrarchus labrax]|uniref:ADP-ribosylation factor-like protein 6-interacting protein 6 n=1 Tax=Dicentrarchus labrax TaxID=13489 RepID=A0A8C4E440_DICLA|nr:ADP-ribosylation factor-like protein 6-interacting protein 6 [Dicentrarchus labrax]XP_051283282.1 ADP-ribosylation factor-like protein 6-interacting protein 6 [Dicentrarchus labrax]